MSLTKATCTSYIIAHGGCTELAYTDTIVITCMPSAGMVYFLIPEPGPALNLTCIKLMTKYKQFRLGIYVSIFLSIPANVSVIVGK